MATEQQAEPRSQQSVIYAVEPLVSCRTGIERLMSRHSKEFTYYLDKKGPVEPLWEFFVQLESQGRLRICTARHHDRLVGYFLMVTDLSKHYRHLRLCLDDTFYMLPEYRAGFGLYEFIKFCDAEMATMGGPGSCLVIADKIDKDMGPILKRLGYTAEEIRWTRMVEN